VTKPLKTRLAAAARHLIAQRGFDPVLGARPLRRAIQRDIEDPLAERILYGELRPGSIVVVDVASQDAADAPGGEAFTFTGTPKQLPDDIGPLEADQASGVA
jgi:ATP-dependent Clp protease ATP-binding subunit ClpC